MGRVARRRRDGWGLCPSAEGPIRRAHKYAPATFPVLEDEAGEGQWLLPPPQCLFHGIQKIIRRIAAAAARLTLFWRPAAARSTATKNVFQDILNAALA